MSTFEETKKLLNESDLFYIVCIGMDSRFTYANSRYQKRFKHVSENLIGEHYKVSVHEDDLLVCSEVSTKCFEQPEKTFPATIRKHDGKSGYLYTQWDYKAVFNEAGEPEGMFCLGYDITEAVTEKNENQQSKTILKKKESILTEIAFNQSHLIRRPLSNILGLVSLLKNMEMDDELRIVCDLIIESSDQLDIVIKEVINKVYEG